MAEMVWFSFAVTYIWDIELYRPFSWHYSGKSMSIHDIIVKRDLESIATAMFMM